MWELIKYIYEQIQLHDKQLDAVFGPLQYMDEETIKPSPVTIGASLGAQTVKNLLVMQETGVRSLGQEDPLEKEMATHSSILAWRIPWTEEVLADYSPWDRKESDTAQRLTLHFLPVSPCININLYSCCAVFKAVKMSLLLQM